MHFEMSSAICFNLDQSKILSSGNGLILLNAQNQTFCLLTLPKQALVFMCLQHKPFENTVGKEEIAHNEQFLLFQVFFLPV